MDISKYPNNLFKFEQDSKVGHLNMFGKWNIVDGLSDVHSTFGKKLGEIKSLLGDLKTSIIEFVVFQFDPVLGLGEKKYFLPWNRINIENQRMVLFVANDLKILTNAPSFHQNRSLRTANCIWKMLKDTGKTTSYTRHLIYQKENTKNI